MNIPHLFLSDQISVQFGGGLLELFDLADGVFLGQLPALTPLVLLHLADVRLELLDLATRLLLRAHQLKQVSYW